MISFWVNLIVWIAFSVAVSYWVGKWVYAVLGRNNERDR